MTQEEQPGIPAHEPLSFDKPFGPTATVLLLLLVGVVLLAGLAYAFGPVAFFPERTTGTVVALEGGQYVSVRVDGGLPGYRITASMETSAALAPTLVGTKVGLYNLGQGWNDDYVVVGLR